ncbi:MAG: twin-arginine translocase subunit TatC [Alphaproteobacteria bacterium]|nr:twin-arginine translocase subunit TatC [Alphaproteobacteria bacterium]
MEDKDENLISHLEALRSMLIKCFAALGIGLIPMFLLAPVCINALIRIMIGDNQVSLNFFSPMEVFILQIKVAVVLDFLVCFPYIAKKIWDFVLPALYENERRFIKSVVLASSSLFISGVLFCIFFILPLLINFGISFATEDIKAVFGISNIISTALWLSVIFGLMFQFPLITYSLIRSQIVSSRTIKDKRPYVFIAILIIAALLTPPDIVSQLMLAAPTYLLFEIGLYFAGKNEKKDLT